MPVREISEDNARYRQECGFLSMAPSVKGAVRASSADGGRLDHILGLGIVLERYFLTGTFHRKERMKKWRKMN